MANLNREPSPLIFMIMASEMVRRRVRIYVAQPFRISNRVEVHIAWIPSIWPQSRRQT